MGDLAVLQLARKVPRLMPGYPSGGGGMSAIGSVRQMASLHKSQPQEAVRLGP